MPKKGYKQTKEHKRKNSLSRTKRKPKFCKEKGCNVRLTNYRAERCKSHAVKFRMSDTTKHPFYGKHLSFEHKRKISKAEKGKIVSKKTRIKISKSGQGRKHSKETRQLMSQNRTKEKNHFFNKKHTKKWKKEQSLRKGGTGIPGELSEYGPEFTSRLKEQIRKRDDYQCKNCPITEEENLIVYNRVLEVHHIDYNKKNNKKYNLIALCKKCHVKTNFNRKYWTKYFYKKLEKIYAF